MTCRIAILISGSGSNMEAIARQCASGELNAEVVLVASNVAGAGGLQRAAAYDIPTCVVSHRNYADREQFDRAMAAAIDDSKPDLVILAGFMRILSPWFVQHYSARMLNIHPSLLPKYQGLHTHRRALEAGDAEHGTSVHFVTEELDGGPLVLQARIPILAEDNEETLTERVKQQEHQLYPEAIRWFADGRLQMDNGTVFMDGEALPATGVVRSAAHTAGIS